MAAQGKYEMLKEYATTWLAAKPKATSAAAYFIQSLKALSHIGFAELSNRSETQVYPDISVVQFWDKEEPPKDVFELMCSWRTHNPTLRYRRFSETTAREFIFLNFGDKEAKAFDLCHHAAMKSDYFRLTYLYTSGGVYVDADDRCLKSIDPIIANLTTTNLIASIPEEFPGYVHNWFLAANPGSAIVRMAIDQATDDIIDSDGRSRRPDIWQTTGPGLITRCVAAVCAQREVDVDKEVRLMTLEQYRNFVHEQGNLEYKHSFEGNWRNFS
jgi:mannosyltransferase OCH1-like enzyme